MSQAFAIAQSRFTVAGEMPRASAVSSIDKESHSHNLCQPFIQLREPIERAIQGDHIQVSGLGNRHPFIQRNLQAFAPLRCISRSRMIDKDTAHHLRRDSEKVRTALPIHILIDQSQIRFVDQGRAL